MFDLDNNTRPVTG